MRFITVLALALVGVAPAIGARADVPFQFAAPGLRAPDDPHVNGIRFTVFEGRNQTVRGVDLGMFSLSDTGNLLGFSAVLGVGRLSGDLRGCATGVANLHEGVDRGVNFALFNQVRRVERGANIGVLNLSDDYSIVDVGGMNLSDRSAVQVGILNITGRIEAVQVGLLNFADNGFLPIFPFFNFPVR